MITIESVSKRYGDRLAVDDLSFTVQPGRVTGFLGPNGSGKSTTMRMIVGLDAPTAGQALVNGRPYAEHDAPITQVGALLEDRGVHPGRTAVAHLRALAATHGIGRRRVMEVLEMVGLLEVAGRRAGGFSLGVSGSPRPCWAIRRSCCSTSPSTAWIPTGCAGSASCCAAWRRTAGRCSSPAT